MRHAPVRLVLVACAASLALTLPASAQCPYASDAGSAPSILAGLQPSGAALGAGSGAGASRSAAGTSQGTSAFSLFGGPRIVSGRCARTGRGVSGRVTARATAVTAGVSVVDLQPGWEAWWEDNRHAFLWDERAPSSPRSPTTPRPGRIAADDSALDHAPARREVYTVLVPRLLKLAATDDDPVVLREVALALGRTVEPPLDGPAADALVDLLDHDDLGVQACAAMGLGLLGAEEGYGPLAELAACSQVGHQVCGRPHVPDALRATAALALGLLDHPRAVERLVDLAERLPDGDDAIRSSAILALGVMDDEHVLAAVPWLTEAAGDRRMPLQTQVSVPTSLGRLSPYGADDTLIAVIRDRDSDRPARQAAVVALGRSTTLSDADDVALLRALAEDDRDAATRGLALVTLAGLPDGDDEVIEVESDVARLLERSLVRPDHDADRPWAALAAGVWLRERPWHGRTLEAPLREAYEEQSDPVQRGAHALALGLARADDCTEQLTADFDEAHDEALRGHLAVALGLLGADDAAPRLRVSLLADGAPAWLRADLAEGLRLLDDREAAAAARDAFVEASSSDERRGLATALGTLRHRDALAALTDAAGDEDLDANSRARICAALGRLGEKTSRPWYAELTEDGNPLSPNAVVAALAGDA